VVPDGVGWAHYFRGLPAGQVQLMLPPANNQPTQWWCGRPRHAVNPRPGQAEPQGAAEMLRPCQCALECQYWGTTRAELRSGGENANGAVAPGKTRGWLCQVWAQFSRLCSLVRWLLRTNLRDGRVGGLYPVYGVTWSTGSIRPRARWETSCGAATMAASEAVGSSRGCASSAFFGPQVEKAHPPGLASSHGRQVEKSTNAAA
jgi:hypothetical protein